MFKSFKKFFRHITTIEEVLSDKPDFLLKHQNDEEVEQSRILQHQDTEIFDEIRSLKENIEEGTINDCSLAYQTVIVTNE